MENQQRITFKPEELQEYPLLEKLHIGLSVIGLKGDKFEGVEGSIIALNYLKEDRETLNKSIIEIVVEFNDIPDLQFKKNFDEEYEFSEDVSTDRVIMDEAYVGIMEESENYYCTLKGMPVCRDCGEVLTEKSFANVNKDNLCDECKKIRDMFSRLNIVTYNSKGTQDELRKYDGQQCIVIGHQYHNVDIHQIGRMFDVKMADGNFLVASLDELTVKDLGITGKESGAYEIYDLEVLCRGLKEKGTDGLYKLLKEVSERDCDNLLDIIRAEDGSIGIYEDSDLEDFFIQNNISVEGYIEDVEPSKVGRKVMLLADTGKDRQYYYATIEVQDFANRHGEDLSDETIYYMNTLKAYREDIALAERLEANLSEKTTTTCYVREREEHSDNQALFCGAANLLDELTFEEAEEFGRKLSSKEIYCVQEYFLNYVSEFNVFDGKIEFAATGNLSIPSVIIELSNSKIVQMY